MTEPDKKLCVSTITGAIGLRGLVRLRSFTQEPEAIASYPLFDQDGKVRRVTLKTPMGKEFIAEIDGVDSRGKAEASRGLELFVARDELPQAGAREYYHVDLIGLRVEDQGGNPFGAVLALHDFGGGPVIEIKLPGGRTAMLPFRDAYVPVVDVAGGRVVIAPPENWPESPAQDKRQDKGVKTNAGSVEGTPPPAPPPRGGESQRSGVEDVRGVPQPEIGNAP